MRGAPPLFAIAAWASGCFSDHGLAISVDVGATGATSVELYLGEPCDPANNPQGIDCQSIIPPNATGTMPGTVWFRDADARYSAQVRGGVASFRLNADPATTLPIVLAIGMTTTGAVGTATLRDLAVPLVSASPRVIEARLVAAAPVAADVPAGTTDRVQVWAKQAPASACVVVEHWQAGTPTRDFVVPPEDPDCDGAAAECDPAAYLATLPGGSAGSPRCFAEGTGDRSATCLLGSLGCSDASGALAGTCAPLTGDQVCVPSQFCGCTSAGSTTGPDPGCLLSRIASAATIPRIECQVPSSASASPTKLDLCPNADRATIDMSRFYTADKCKQPQIGSLVLDDFDTSHTFNGAEFDLASPHDPCAFVINWKRGSRIAADATDVGMIELPTQRGTVLLPLVLHFQNTCTAAPPLDAFTCSLLGEVGADDSPLQCAP